MSACSGRYRRILAGVALAILAAGCNASPRDGTPRTDETDQGRTASGGYPRFAGVPEIVDDTLWRFPSGVIVPGRLRAAVEYIGRIDGAGGPYLLASGVECNFCDASLSILLQPVGDTADLLTRGVPGWYVHPGPIRSTGTDAVELETRLFWGQCLTGRGPGLLQFAAEYDSVGALRRRVVRLTEIRDGRLVDDSIMVALPDTADIDAARMAGACHEVEQREQVAGF